ncbi:hypothetical protein [Flavobacterium sp.]|uniref:hypothetical protein n=1 Tax=Flavobacterium sp. TaxID=239 RepID=UPI002B4B5A01|nr:hypothetical protein [Flavobacterium sp.]HLP63546.1 hypothetical protein [Flavobacterium sp.]
MNKKVILLVFIIMGLWSCSHDEGYGGLASISGKIYGKDFNSSGFLVNEDYIGGVKVYISKHGETNYFDSMDSAYDGSFKFNYLHKGTYDIWVFGDCDYCSWDQVFVLKTIEITDKKQEVVTEDFVISF